MKNIFLVILSVAVLSSCTSLKFDKLPGERLSSIPSNITGTYKAKTSWFKKQDSAIYYINQSEIKTMVGKNVIQEMGLNRDFLLTQLDGYYLMGTPDNDIKSLWNIVVIEAKKNQINIYNLVEDKAGTTQNTIEKYLPQMQLPIEHGPIESPGAAVDQQTMLPGKSQGEPDKMFFYMVENEMFLSFLKAELKNMEPFVLVKHKVK